MPANMPPSRRTVYAGIDPGLSDGVIVWGYQYHLPRGWFWRVESERIERDPVKMYNQFFRVATFGYERHAVLEKAGMHRAQNSAMSSAAAARHNGNIEMALISLGFKFDIIQPTKWMNTLGPGRPKDRAERKTWIHNIVTERHDRKIFKYEGDAFGIFDYLIEEKEVEIVY